MSFKTTKEDYKGYIYIRIPKVEYEAIMKGKRKVSADDIEEWRFNYEVKQVDKKVKAKRASKIKQSRTIQKIYKALENYYLGLFKEEVKELTPYQLAKLAKVNYVTARKFFETHNLNDWIKKFEDNPTQELRNFKIEELADYFL